MGNDERRSVVINLVKCYGAHDPVDTIPERNTAVYHYGKDGRRIEFVDPVLPPKGVEIVEKVFPTGGLVKLSSDEEQALYQIEDEAAREGDLASTVEALTKACDRTHEAMGEIDYLLSEAVEGEALRKTLGDQTQCAGLGEALRRLTGLRNAAQWALADASSKADALKKSFATQFGKEWDA